MFFIYFSTADWHRIRLSASKGHPWVLPFGLNTKTQGLNYISMFLCQKITKYFLFKFLTHKNEFRCLSL